jgi:hypothetical protein
LATDCQNSKTFEKKLRPRVPLFSSVKDLYS